MQPSATAPEKRLKKISCFHLIKFLQRHSLAVGDQQGSETVGQLDRLVLLLVSLVRHGKREDFDVFSRGPNSFLSRMVNWSLYFMVFPFTVHSVFSRPAPLERRSLVLFAEVPAGRVLPAKKKQQKGYQQGLF